MALTPMHARKAQRDRDRAEAEARLLQEALGLTTATPVATDPLADKPDAPQTMQPPQTEVVDLQHQVAGLKLQLTEILEPRSLCF